MERASTEYAFRPRPARLSNPIIVAFHDRKFVSFAAIVILIAATAAAGQRVATISPEKADLTERFAAKIESALEARFRVLDRSMAESAFRSAEIPEPFNMSSEEGVRLGSVIGCDVFVVLRAAVQRRESLDRPAYFEAYAVSYVIDARSGEMIAWDLMSREAPVGEQAATRLLSDAAEMAAAISSAIEQRSTRISQMPRGYLESVPEPGSRAAAGLTTPIPYKRIKPEYTSTAYLYGIKGTVDIEVQIDADGSVAGTRIVRWVGFGLERSVEDAVRSMNWRPAMRNGKPLPMRILLRYNFTKIEKDEAP